MANENQRRDVRHARDSTDDPIEAGLARQLSELAREMQAETTTDALLERITHSAVAEIEGADFAGISLIEGGNIRTRAATDSLIEKLDHEQYRLEDGPCISSLRDEMTVRCDDLENEQRWPRFAAEALETGVRSLLCVQLFVEGDNLGALNLFATTPDAFTDHDESIALLLAAHAAIALKGSTVESNLRIALESRDTIGQAKGVLMERYKISALEAFNLLVVASQRSHIKLRDVADALAATGELPTGTGTSH